jgi:hypothetical protein
MARLKNAMSFEEKKREAYRFFIEKGYTPAQAAGIVGNLIAESSLNTTIKGDKNTSSYAVGLAQWRLDRKDTLRNRYGEGWTDFYNQLDFVDWELKNTEKRAYRELQKTATPEEAALVISQYYERPHKDYAHNDRRKAHAIKLYQSQDQNIYSTDSRGQIVTVNPEAATIQQRIQSDGIKNQFYDNYLTNLGIPPEITTFVNDNDFVIAEDGTTGTTIINNYYETPKEEVKEEKPEVSEAQQRLQAKKAERQFLVDLVSSGQFDLQAPQYQRTSIMQKGGQVKIINEQGEEEMIDSDSQRYRDYYSQGDLAALNTETGDLMMSQDAVLIAPGDYNPDIPQEQYGIKGFLTDAYQAWINPKNYGVPDYSGEGRHKDNTYRDYSFNEAYNKARQEGQKKFIYNNKRYSTLYDGTPQEQMEQTGITDNLIKNRGLFGISDEVRTRVNENVALTSYTQPANAIKSIITNKPMFHRESEEGYTDSEGNVLFELAAGEDPQARDVHFDLLSMSAGKPQRYKTMTVSKHKPSNSKEEDVEYYTFKETKPVFKGILKALEREILNGELKRKVTNAVELEEAIYGREQSTLSEFTPLKALKDFTIDTGEDEKGKYISIYDINDYSPFGGLFNKEGKTQKTIPFLNKPEIYDRIYYTKDKKGGIKLKEQHENK